MDSDTKCFDHPFRTVSQNNENENGAAIGVEFMKFEHPVEYPTDEEVHAMAAKVIWGKDGASNPYHTSGGKLLALVEEIVKKDTLADLLEEEKELLWLLRYVIWYLKEEFQEFITVPEFDSFIRWTHRPTEVGPKNLSLIVGLSVCVFCGFHKKQSWDLIF